MLSRPIAIFGGTFDPVHNGHLRLAVELRDRLDVAEVRLGDEPHLRLDDRELLREGPSYTIDTLKSFRGQFPDAPLCLVMGTDAFAGLASWRDWRALFDYAHVILIDRPGMEDLPPVMRGELDERRSDEAWLYESLAGAVHVCELPPLAISSSRIRALIEGGRSPRFLLPEAVLEDIRDDGIYGVPQAETP